MVDDARLRQLGKANILVLLVGVIAICLAIGVPIGFCFGAGPSRS